MEKVDSYENLLPFSTLKVETEWREKLYYPFFIDNGGNVDIPSILNTVARNNSKT
jgi:hypothetical protein